ncbi:hypothetical protein FLL45_00275 [Aliikangiella marina]|uniref:Uncharacterized protein n=1 Tax=Aliikangiella marina TaxID=1712262 RepID=A0A545TGT4_9GAMM|nr:hypothetical protein [Aliikangiella marina]TQV76437.1 hypothetical protein FLL45_00275 [Aliikangiella marina]
MGPTEALAQPAYELTSKMLNDKQLPLSIPLIAISLSAYGIALAQYQQTVIESKLAFATVDKGQIAPPT